MKKIIYITLDHQLQEYEKHIFDQKCTKCICKFIYIDIKDFSAPTPDSFSTNDTYSFPTEDTNIKSYLIELKTSLEGDKNVKESCHDFNIANFLNSANIDDSAINFIYYYLTYDDIDLSYIKYALIMLLLSTNKKIIFILLLLTIDEIYNAFKQLLPYTSNLFLISHKIVQLMKY